MVMNFKARINMTKCDMLLENEGQKYDLIAQDFANLRDSFNTEKKYIDLLVNHIQPGASILDIGCGSGYPIASYLIENGFYLTGIDSSQKLLDIAKINCPMMNCIHGDIRTISVTDKYDAIIEWWCLFHLPKADHAKMFFRFASWLKDGGILEFTTGADDFEGTSSEMLGQPLNFYSHAPAMYETFLKQNGFKLLLKEHDQEQHLVWIAQKI